MSVDAGESTCPMCAKYWLVTPREDCLMPACGHFGFDSSPDNPNRPCEPCGLKHAWSCPDLGRGDVEPPEEIEVVEVQVWNKRELN